MIRMPNTWYDESDGDDGNKFIMTFRNPQLFRKTFHCMLSSYLDSIDMHQGGGHVVGDILLYQDDHLIAKMVDQDVYMWSHTNCISKEYLDSFVDEVMSFVTVLVNEH